MRFGAQRNDFVSRAIAALLAVLVCAGALDWGHVGGDDRDCDTALVLHDHSAHRLGAARSEPSSSGDHCYLCHSLRLLHAALSPRHERVDQDLQASSRIDTRSHHPQHASGHPLPSRAPPADLL